MIDVKDVSLKIKKTVILEHVDMHVKCGEICGIVGRNGSGKTMLMKCICGLVPVSEGEIRVDDRVVGREIDFPDSMGVIIETPSFIGSFTGYQNLKLLAGYRNIIGKNEIEDSMRLVGLNPNLRSGVKKYSLGMKQRLGIAQAIMENPRILILDEPFNSLDSDGVDKMRKLLLSYKEAGKCILISSHNYEDIDILCDRQYNMDKGRIYLQTSQM